MKTLLRVREVLRGTMRPVGHRPFCSSNSASSHIGSMPVTCPPTVTFTLQPQTHLSPSSTPKSSINSAVGSTPISSSPSLRVSGPRGSLLVDIKPFVHLNPQPSSSTSPSTLLVTVQDPSIKYQRAIWGLTRSLIANAVTGVSDGYSLSLRLVGVGYRAAVESAPGSTGLPAQRLNLKLGFAHPVLVEIPSDVQVATPSTTTIVLSGIDKQRLGEVAARIRSWRVPEPYNGKGVFVGGEIVRRKEVKKK